MRPRVHDSSLTLPCDARLQELCIAHCSDIFHAKSFADLAQLQVRGGRACLPAGACTHCTLQPQQRRRRPPVWVHPATSPTHPPALFEQRLETLAVTFMTGRLAPADLAPLEGLRRLRTLTLSASRDAEEAGEACLHAFPDSLLRLRGLTSLGLCSMGARWAC